MDYFPDKCSLYSKNENYLYLRQKSIQASLSVCRSLCVFLTITSKAHSINSISHPMIRMLLFPDNSFIASAFFSVIYGFGDSPLRSHLKSRFARPPLLIQSKTAVLRYFCRKYCWINTSI